MSSFLPCLGTSVLGGILAASIAADTWNSYPAAFGLIVGLTVMGAFASLGLMLVETISNINVRVEVNGEEAKRVEK